MSHYDEMPLQKTLQKATILMMPHVHPFSWTLQNTEAALLPDGLHVQGHPATSGCSLVERFVFLTCPMSAGPRVSTEASCVHVLHLSWHPSHPLGVHSCRALAQVDTLLCRPVHSQRL